MSPKLQPVRGTHDILPEENLQRRWLLEKARAILECYGYGEITPPVFEFTEVFQRTLGETSDVVSKETYTLADRGGESLTLRPEFTAGIARAFISGGLAEKLPLKLWSTGPAFRYERPQKGRLRQFHQLDAELLGVAGPEADIELIALGHDILKAIGLQNVTLELNSLGDSESRANYRTALVDYYQSYRDQLSEDSKIRLERNPLRILDSKDEGDKKINAGAPPMEKHFTAEASDFFARVKEGLAGLHIPFTVNPRLVRGLDYYVHTVFEFTAEGLGAQNTVLAGGRYDGLIGMMGGPATPGIGWAAGIERLIAIAASPKDEAAARRPVAVVPMGEEAEKEAFLLTYELRRAGFATELLLRGNPSKKLAKANKMHASAALIIGEQELKDGIVSLRLLDSGEQSAVARKDLLSALAGVKSLKNL